MSKVQVVTVEDSRGYKFLAYVSKDKDGNTVYLDKALEDLRQSMARK